MFRFSDDEFIANKQKEEATALLESLLKYVSIEHSPKIEKFFEDNVKTYEFLEELPSISTTNNDTTIMRLLPYDYSHESARVDLGEDFKKIQPKPCDGGPKLWKEITIPFIDFSFPSTYNCKYGEGYKHVYIFFLTNFTEFEQAQECMLYYLNKLNKLKVFL